MAATQRETSSSPAAREALLARYRHTRAFTERLCEPLEAEDYVVQPMPDASPVKWHLAHTSWFFETFVLRPLGEGYQSPDPRYAFLFNSYYVRAGERHQRDQRGMVTRPTVRETYAYRAHVDAAVARFLAEAPAALLERAAPVVELGLHHEQQHQELLVTDLKYLLSRNPLAPAYLGAPPDPAPPAPPLHWAPRPGGLVEIGHAGAGFCFDNETPRHRTYLHSHALASRLTTNAEYQEFLEDGGYRRPELWLSDGWARAVQEGWEAPLYWRREREGWEVFTAHGPRPLDPNEPACHVSYFEAEAYARWRGCRLPTEAEWEAAAAEAPARGNFAESGRCHPAAAEDGPGLQQLFGDAWEWTASAYSPYPGFQPLPGMLGEYNGKFMCGQYVLRGGSCATPETHVRPTYRNFFHPHCRWQFSGIRLARDSA